jgi:hypothetical protein
LRHLYALVTTCALLLTACAAPQQATKTETGGGGAPAGAAESTEAASVAKIGQGFTYKDGLGVTVVSAKKFKIGQYAAGGKPGGTGVIITVTLNNGTKAPFDAALTTVGLAHGADGDQAEQVFDSDAGLGTGFTGKVQPGRKATAKFGFAVPAASMRDLQIEVKPGFLEHDSVLFSGSA